MAVKSSSEIIVGFAIIMLGLGVILFSPIVGGNGSTPVLGGDKQKVVCDVDLKFGVLATQPTIDSYFCRTEGSCILGMYSVVGNPMAILTYDGKILLESSGRDEADMSSYSVKRGTVVEKRLNICTDDDSVRLVLYDKNMRVLDSRTYEVGS